MTYKEDLIKRIKGRIKIVDRTKKTYPYSKWITKTKHVMYDTHGLWILDTTESRRYNKLEHKTIKEIEFILKKL